MLEYKEQEELDEMSASSDIASGPGQVLGPVQHRGKPLFDIEDREEFLNFNRGTKVKFKRWKQYTKNRAIHDWAKQNPGKDFFIRHRDAIVPIKRSKP